MEEKELRSLLMQRLHLELLVFKDRMLQKDKEEIYRASYEIETHMDLYRIFDGYADLLEEDTLRMLLNFDGGILGSFYQEWMEHRDMTCGELDTYMHDRLELLSVMGKSGNNGRKEDGSDGTGYGQAA